MCEDGLSTRIVFECAFWSLDDESFGIGGHFCHGVGNVDNCSEHMFRNLIVLYFDSKVNHISSFYLFVVLSKSFVEVGIAAFLSPSESGLGVRNSFF